MKQEQKPKVGVENVDVEDFNPKPVPEAELQQLLAQAPDFVKKRAAEWAKHREELGAEPVAN